MLQTGTLQCAEVRPKGKTEGFAVWVNNDHPDLVAKELGPV